MASPRRRNSNSSSESNDDQDIKFNWNHAILKLGTTAAGHPLEYIKFLIQIGHEPLPPTPTRTLFNRPALALPGFFRYAGHVCKVDGFFGLYRGLLPKVIGCAIYNFAYTNVKELIADTTEGQINENEDSNRNETTMEQKFTIHFVSTSKQIFARCTALVVSQPFYVIAFRSMAQFVGRETKYSGLLSSISEIYNQEGLLGFFSGLVPRVIGEVLSILVTSSICLIVHTYVLHDEETKQYAASCIAFVCGTIMYPFQLVSNVMAVNNSNLVATSYPNMIYYADWTDCWSHLSTMRQLKRGSSLLWRYYTGPTLLHADGTHSPSMPPRFKQSFGVVGAQPLTM